MIKRLYMSINFQIGLQKYASFVRLIGITNDIPRNVTREAILLIERGFRNLETCLYFLQLNFHILVDRNIVLNERNLLFFFR